MKTKTVTTGILVLALLATSIVSAFGVATPYWSEKPLRMYPGESATVGLTLQNVGGETTTFEVTVVSDGNGIATFDSLSYLVPAGATDVYVPIRVEVPENFQYGGVHNIQVKFKPTVPIDENAQVAIQPAFTTGFPVEVVGVEESTFYVAPEKPDMTPYLIGALVLIIILLIIIVVLKKKK